MDRKGKIEGWFRRSLEALEQDNDFLFILNYSRYTKATKPVTTYGAVMIAKVELLILQDKYNEEIFKDTVPKFKVDHLAVHRGILFGLN